MDGLLESRWSMDMQTALVTDRFHYGECKKIVGPRGGVTITREEWRRNGMNQTKKGITRIPIKYGMRSYDAIDPFNVDRFHAASDCTIND